MFICWWILLFVIVRDNTTRVNAAKCRRILTYPATSFSFNDTAFVHDSDIARAFTLRTSATYWKTRESLLNKIITRYRKIRIYKIRLRVVKWDSCILYRYISNCKVIYIHIIKLVSKRTVHINISSNCGIWTPSSNGGV